MRFEKVVMAALAVVAGGLAASCDAGDREGETADTTAFDTTAPPPPQAQAGALTDAQIAHIVVIANTADSAAGELAQSKGSSEQVKAFGRRMVQDHGAANQQATQLAQRAGLAPEESDMSRMMQGMADTAMQRLQGLSGAEFDRAYLEHEVMMHQHVLDDLDQNLIPGAQNPELKQLLQSVRPTIDSHLQQARQLQSGGTGAAGGNGTDTSGTGGT